MTNDNTLLYIKEHRNDDVRQLALQAPRNTDIDLPFALDQIAGWQTARHKLPTWAATDGLIYPPHLSMEQCSSEQTAGYKVEVLRRIFSSAAPQATEEATQATEAQQTEGSEQMLSMVDLTGGFGVDFSYLAPHFAQATYVERNARLCQGAEHNFALLGLSHAQVVCAEAEQYVDEMQPVSLIYLDPARRDAQGGKTVAIAQCTPDVAALLPLLLKKAQAVMVKLSPMLDWHKAIVDLNNHIASIDIVATHGECKELLLVLRPQQSQEVRVTCVNDAQRFSFSTATPYASPVPLAQPLLQADEKWRNTQGTLYLFEPNAAIMKAGCFAALAQTYGVRAVGANSHLFVADHDISHFPGRRFAVTALSTLNKQALKTVLAGVTQANVAVRNFPLTAEALRKKLKLRDGSDRYLFATTDTAGTRLLFCCQQAVKQG